MKKSKPVRWFSVRDDRRRLWTVYLTRPDISPEITDQLYGICIPETRRILINVNQPIRTWEDTILHEILHVAAQDTAAPREELNVTIYATRSLPIIKQLGFGLPKRPKLPWPRQR